MDKILIVDDDITLTMMLKTLLAKRGFEPLTASDAARAVEALSRHDDISLVLTDMRLPDKDGTYLLEWLGRQHRPLPVIVMTGYADIDNAVLSMKLGAADYITKPIRPDMLLEKIGEAEAARRNRAEDAPKADDNRPAETSSPARAAQPSYIEGRSEASARLYEYISLVAPTDMSVLVRGASGTGKEHVAHLLHERSARCGKPFVAVDCGTVSRELAASEFFGHVKGAFTGAVADKKGAFESAAGGTLFLDEVGNLAYDTQIQLLRALQQKTVRPVGSNREAVVDVRIVAATNEDLEVAIDEGRFRSDLYYRLSEFTLQLPTLSSRREDIMLYADFFLDEANRRLSRRIAGFDEHVRRLFEQYEWTGNLRELKNTVTRAALLTTGRYITAESLPQHIVDPAAAERPAAADTLSLHDPERERQSIERALRLSSGNKSQAARLLGIDRKTLYNKLSSLGID